VTFVLALDQGTTGSAALVFDAAGAVRGGADREIAQSYPASGHVEHDPDEIFATTVAVGRDALAAGGVGATDIAAIGITNQRETTVVWERATGRPIHPAVVWQSRASAAICEELRARGLGPLVRERTGLVIDAYFSATKVRWILDQVRGAQARAAAGELLCGTIDTWLVWKLTGGRAHITDVSNASRTMVFDIHRQRWDDELLAALDLPRAMFAKPVSSMGVVGETDPAHFGRALPIAGIAGDQQAALFGQTCFAPGEAKNTYGTGCFLLANTGATAAPARGGLLTTIAWDLGDGVRYALEGSAFVTGAAVQWLRDGLGIIATADATEALATGLEGNDGVYFVPAFTGLGAPHWDMYARGLLIGIERGTTRAHIARATLESIAYQTRDLVEAMRAAGESIDVLRADGGGTANRFLMQFQSDLLGVPVEVAAIRETTALGAAFLAGLAVGVWKTPDELRRKRAIAARYEPKMSADQREQLYADWQRALERSRGWASRSTARGAITEQNALPT
jgi:glycerol kinase